MLRTDFGKFKYLGLFAALNVSFLLLANFTAGRIISLFGVGVSLPVLYFPVVYIIGDILTEVYGYAQARSILWMSIFCSVATSLAVKVALLVPPAPFFENDAAFQLVFSPAPRIAIASLLGIFFGDICNSYVLAKMKVWHKGGHLWMRFISSTIVGEGVDTVLFYGLGLYGILPSNKLAAGILAAWSIKTLVEVVMLPVTYPVVRFLKRVEGVDYYDTHTNFNPFVTDVVE